ncbi:hypothetical protein [Trueperella bialowiezensis]|uniref:Uncharacterized protein n=1 Tax=Trueperella bialowiezensis TaxID=312285 RepID=A0A3S4X645_9ACTO|nr:hypothetical protein [Trueperella bialowiezensis]VEI13460.1 Uncharacterised protein [Trueperella bialowiezensis]
MVTFMLAVSAPQAEALLQGYDVVSGYAVDAAAGSRVTEVSDLLDLLCLRFPDTPFADDEPLDIVHLPSDPFTMDRHAVGPLHPDAIRGGVIDYGFDGSGVARGGGVETDLLYLEPCRVTSGATLWRFYPGNPQPEHRGTYHGIAYGWENMETGTFTAAVPTPFLGPVIKRDWGAVPCDVEVEGGKPVAVTMVSPAEPDQEDGFQLIESGMWAKRIAVDDSAHIYTEFVTGRVSGMPVRVVRTVNSNGRLLLQVASALTDALYLTRAQFQRWSSGTFTALIAPDKVTDQRRIEAKPTDWDVADRPAIAARRESPVNFSDANELLRETFTLVSDTAPPDWREVTLRIQLVGTSALYEGYAKLDGDRFAAMRVLPTAVIHYMRRLKQDRVLAGEEPFLVAVIRLGKDGQGTLNVNGSQEPVWADHVDPAEWSNEMAAFPREAPDWMEERLASAPPATHTGPTPYPADLTANIHWIKEITGEDEDA